MTHVELCRPICYFVATHILPPLNLTEDELRDLMRNLEKDGFTLVAGDYTGFIISLNRPFEVDSLRDHIFQLTRQGFFITSINISLVAAGLVLITALVWYAFHDIPVGEDKDIGIIKPILKYLEGKIEKVVAESVKIRVIRGIRKCFFEHPGAYIGHF